MRMIVLLSTCILGIALTACEMPLNEQQRAELRKYEEQRACLDSLWRLDSVNASVARIPACKFK